MKTEKTTNMKNSEIHRHLSHSEFRDFLSTSLFDIKCKDMENQGKLEYRVRPRVGSVDRAIHEAEANLTYWQQKLELLQRRKTLLIPIEANGWAEYDVSSDTDRGLAFPPSMSFIGTMREYKDLLSRL